MSELGDDQLFARPERTESNSIILHIDMDCFYAACERLREPELVDEPVIIGMGYDANDPSGAVATASYEARSFGIESAMPISEALDILPRRTVPSEDPTEPTGLYRPVEMDYYSEISADVRGILRDYADVFEPVSIDEAYMDVTDRTNWNSVEGYAAEIKSRISTEIGVTASIGVAPTKSAAKVASDHDKPDGLVIIAPGEVTEFFAELSIEAVHGVGPVTANRLREMDIDTAGKLASTDPVVLEEEFGTRGREFYDRVHGIDPRPVTPPDDPKSLSKESSTGEPVVSMEEKQSRIESLAYKVSERAVEKDAMYQTIGIKIVTPPYEIHTRARSLNGPVQDSELVRTIALDLLEEFSETPVRKLGVRVSKLSFTERNQADLASWSPDDASPAPQSRRTITTPQKTRQLTLTDFVDQ